MSGRPAGEATAGGGPTAVAVRTAHGLTLRGHEWPVDGPAVVFVHDLGDDLDAWGPVTARMAAAGFRVISMELRGHGLSGGEPDPELLLDDLTELLAEITGSFGPVGIVSYGRAACRLLYLNEGAGVPVQALISPFADGEPDWRGTRSAVRIFLDGSQDEDRRPFLDRIYPKVLGVKLRVSGAAAEAGPQLLEVRPQLLEHLIMFMRRQLTPRHLAWIAQRAELRAAAPAEAVPEDEQAVHGGKE